MASAVVMSKKSVGSDSRRPRGTAPLPRLRVLAISPEIPSNLEHGGHLRTFRLLQKLRMIADVELVCASRGGAGSHALSAPTPCRVVGSGEVVGDPPGQTDAGVCVWLREHATPDAFDSVLLCGPAAGAYAENLVLPAVWDLVDEQALAFLRSARRRMPLQAIRELRYAIGWRRYERVIASRCAATVLVSPDDAAFARRFVARAPIDVIANGVDADHFAPDPSVTRAPARLVFVGVLEFRPNADAAVWFVRRIWPALRRAVPQLELRIVGPAAPPAVVALNDVPGVSVVGRVDDVREELRAATAAIAPLRIGGGIKNKILEAWACGTPVISTPLALAGLSADGQRTALVVRNRNDWISAVQHLTAGPAVAADIGERSRMLVVEHYSWKQSAASMLAVLRRAAGGVS